MPTPINTLIVAVYTGIISDNTLILATNDETLTRAVYTWMKSCEEIECKLEGGEIVPVLRTGTDDTSVFSMPLTSLRLSVYEAKHSGAIGAAREMRDEESR